MLKKILKVSLNILGVFAFLCAIAYAILAAYGYRIDFVSRSAVKTSIIHIANKFKDVTVTLNEKEVAKKTPTEINFVIPGLNNLKIEKEGYYTWEKDLLVIEDFVTKLDDVFLISKKISKTMQVIPIDFQFEVFDIGDKDIFFVSQADQNIYVYDLDKNLSFFIDQNNNDDIHWDADYIYFVNHNYLVFETSAITQIVEISEDFKIKNITGVIVPHDFYGFEITYIDGVKGIYFKDDSLYMVWIDKGGKLERIDKMFEASKKISWFKMVTQYDEHFIYLDNEVYFKENGQFILLDQNVKDLDVSSDDDFLIYLKGDYDIMLYDFESGDTTLLEHFSNKINDIELNSNNRQIILKQENNISICDFDFINCFVIDEITNSDYASMAITKSPQLFVMGDTLKIYNLKVE